MSCARVAALRLGAARVSGARSARNYATLLVADHNNKALSKGTLQAATAAAKLPGMTSLDVLVLGNGCGEVAKECSKIKGVSKVLLAESEQLEHPVADTAIGLLAAVQQSGNYTVVSSVASSFAKETFPRLAAKLDVQPISDVIEVTSEEGVFKRPMYAGNAIATVKSNDQVKIVTFRATSFEAAALDNSAAVEAFKPDSYESSGVQWLSESEKQSDKPQLASASRVVSGGRGMKSGENFEKVLEPLCDKLNAAMGASRAAVDAGMVPNELQVGQTGKVVAPELYVAVGISGAIQHLAGMKDSKTIVAINKDVDAPIFQVADYGLVGDLFEKVPELTQKV
eukprot:CAMPEP_0206443896 /NCGR_PEP_ID=MMETSP0324_2-20121206/14621_1 /ASSEMBLY_ACC=CAM_ASM_000836 /TAXON_ID=2866 /ORGANISM="Crypthecodinium cohnii, Strain Seligo" /LENGTH=339 /DNA_ID=CAMNT_0053911879 /DNA_START=88 /DNA_END=1107 /DNA_ORIENTATION=-